MANEAVLIENPTEFRRYTIGGAITRFTLLKLSDPNTASATSADNDPFAGIAWEDVTAAEYAAGKTEVVAALNGIWDLKTDASTPAAGAIVNITGANLVGGSAAADLLTGSVVGKVLETASSGEVVRTAVGRVV